MNVNRARMKTTGDNSPIYNAEHIDINTMTPISVDPTEMAQMINMCYEGISVITHIVDETFNEKLKRTNMPEKNRINGMSQQYYIQGIREYVVHFQQIDEFLGDPRNELEYERYKYVARDIHLKLLAYKGRIAEFADRYEMLVTEFIRQSAEKYDLDFRKKKLIRIFFAYMYYFCDIGENIEDQA